MKPRKHPGLFREVPVLPTQPLGAKLQDAINVLALNGYITKEEQTRILSRIERDRTEHWQAGG